MKGKLSENGQWNADFLFYYFLSTNYFEGGRRIGAVRRGPWILRINQSIMNFVFYCTMHQEGSIEWTPLKARSNIFFFFFSVEGNDTKTKKKKKTIMESKYKVADHFFPWCVYCIYSKRNCPWTINTHQPSPPRHIHNPLYHKKTTKAC